MTTTDKPLSAAELTEIRGRHDQRSIALAIDRDFTIDEEVEMGQDMDALLRHLDALAGPARQPIEARDAAGVVYYVTTGEDGSTTVTPRDTCAPSPVFPDASKEEKGTMLRAAFDQGRAAERRDLTAPLPEDGGEVLGRDLLLSLRPRDGERMWPVYEAEDRAPWIAGALALYQRGHAAGQASREGEVAELRAALNAAGETETRIVNGGGDIAERDRLTAEITRFRDCGDRAVCCTPPGCCACWAERNRELAVKLHNLTAENLMRIDAANFNAASAEEIGRRHLAELAAARAEGITIGREEGAQLAARERSAAFDEWQRLLGQSKAAARLEGALEERAAIRADVVSCRANADADGRYYAFDYVVRLIDGRAAGTGGGG